MEQKILNHIFIMLAFMGMFSIYSCSSSDNNDDIDKETSLEKAVVGSWYFLKDNYIYSVNTKKDGTGKLTTYVYESKQWTETTTSIQYAISDNTVTVKMQDEDAWTGTLAVTGNSMSITKGSDVLLFTGFDGNTESLKAEIEENWLEKEPSYVTPEYVFTNSEENVKLILSALYNSLITYEYQQLNLESIRIYGKDLNDNAKQITPSSDEIKNTWEAAYSTITQANTIISSLQEKTEYKAYRNEALAIRCLVYYNIANLWGSIPYTEVSGDQALTNPSIYTCKQVLNTVKNTLSTLDTFTKEDYHINTETIKALQAEIALCENNKKSALEYLENCNADFSLFINNENEREIYKLLGEKIGNYTLDIMKLLKQEANGNTTDIVNQWQSVGSHTWGYWLMLKRTGNAKTVSGCNDYELLMPFPTTQLDIIPTLTQNPGY